jgi:hypothetical protein
MNNAATRLLYNTFKIINDFKKYRIINSNIKYYFILQNILF